MRRSKDSLTAAIASILKPAVTPLGFRKLSSRSFGRIHDGVLQYFNFQLSSHGTKQFCVNFTSITLYSPRDCMVFQPGNRLPRYEKGDGWWASSTHDDADNSMRDIVEKFTAIALPWFERTHTTAALLAVLKEGNTEFDRPDAHYLFAIACCQVHLGQLREAWTSLDQAVKIYQEWHQELSRTWCLEGISWCEQLLAAIRDSQYERLLTDWLAHSIKHLKLEKILSA